MTEETYPDKAIFYLPNTTPVFIICNPTDPFQFGGYKLAKESFEGFGYRDIRIQKPIDSRGADDQCREEEFPWYDPVESDTSNYRDWLTHLRLWKKCIGYNKPIVVTHHLSMLVKDIPNNREHEGLIALGTKQVPVRPRRFGVDIQRGYVIYPKQANKLMEWAIDRENLPSSVSHVLWNEYAGLDNRYYINLLRKEYAIANGFEFD